jgi:hypothetical protein
MDNGHFIFGSPIEKIVQKDRTPKKCFVLGKYPSAVHARFVSNTYKCNALAVKSEPYIFWKGDGAEEIICDINNKVPKNYGEFVLPDNRFNGPTGNTLDEKYLGPLKYNRKDAWLCDLVPYFMVNKNGDQHNAQNGFNEYFKDFPEIASEIPMVSNNINEIPVKEILDELEESKADTIILLGQDAIEWFLCKVSDCKNKKLKDFQPYGVIRTFNFVNSKEYNVYPLVHPHLLEKNTKYWAETHYKWIKSL